MNSHLFDRGVFIIKIITREFDGVVARALGNGLSICPAIVQRLIGSDCEVSGAALQGDHFQLMKCFKFGKNFRR